MGGMEKHRGWVWLLRAHLRLPDPVDRRSFHPKPEESCGEPQCTHGATFRCLVVEGIFRGVQRVELI